MSHISCATRPFLLPPFLFLPSLSSFSSRPFIIRVAPPSLPVSALFNLAPGDSKEDQVWSWQCQAKLFVSLRYVLHCTRHIFVSMWYYPIHCCFFTVPVWEFNCLKCSGYYRHWSLSIKHNLRTKLIFPTHLVRFSGKSATVSLNGESVFLRVKQWIFAYYLDDTECIRARKLAAMPQCYYYYRHYYYYYYYYYTLWVSLVTGLSEPTVIPTAHASRFTLQYFPYYVWCSKYSCLL